MNTLGFNLWSPDFVADRPIIKQTLSVYEYCSIWCLCMINLKLPTKECNLSMWLKQRVYIRRATAVLANRSYDEYVCDVVALGKRQHVIPKA